VFLGDFSPGDSPAEVQFGGDAVLAPSASLVMEIGGTTPGAEYDVLDVAGRLRLGGTLDVTLVYGFQPRFGQTFDLFHWGSLEGEFDQVNLPTLGAGLAWDASLVLDTGVITVVPEPATLSLLGLGAIGALLRRKRK
jgi:hypothetical protein